MPAGATYEPIATSSPTGTAAVTFSSIPSTYTDLRLVINARLTTGIALFYMRYNGISTTTYSQTYLTGNGTTATSVRGTAQSEIYLGNASEVSTVPTLMTIDIFSYAGSTNKTALHTVAADKNGSGWVERGVTLWRSTSAINQITITHGANLDSGTMFTLYGIKAA